MVDDNFPCGAGSAEHIQLAASHHLYLGPDGGWRLAGPADTYERLVLPPRVGAALEALLSGRATYPVPVAQAGDREILDTALKAFAERGLLVEAPGAATRPARPGPPVVVLGSGAVATRVAELVVSAGHEVRRRASLTGADLDGAGAVIACASWLTDATWQEFDARCARSGLAWHRCYLEGGRQVLGPFSVPGRTASYRDTRARRLAAARQPAELAAAWHHLDIYPPPPLELDPAISAVVAGILAADVLAFLEHRQIPTEGSQLVIHPDTMAMDRHPVLPLPVAVVDGWAEFEDRETGAPP